MLSLTLFVEFCTLEEKPIKERAWEGIDAVWLPQEDECKYKKKQAVSRHCDTTLTLQVTQVQTAERGNKRVKSKQSVCFSAGRHYSEVIQRNPLTGQRVQRQGSECVLKESPFPPSFAPKAGPVHMVTVLDFFLLWIFPKTRFLTWVLKF